MLGVSDKIIDYYFFIPLHQSNKFPNSHLFFELETDRCTSTFHQCLYIPFKLHSIPYHIIISVNYEYFFFIHSRRCVCFFIEKKIESTSIAFILRHICKETHPFTGLLALYSNQYMRASVDCVSKQQQEEVLSCFACSLPLFLHST